MGSQSDYKTMNLAEKILKKIGVSFETRIISAHRTPKRMYDYASSAEKNNIGVIIAGAGGSAPKHVQQFTKEGHLRWDSLGEFLALAVSLEHLGENYNSLKALVLAETLDQATDKFLENKKSPSRKVYELDNRGSHFYLALYWAEALSNQSKDADLKNLFAKIYKELLNAKPKILLELNSAQGKNVDLKGYYMPNDELANKAMRPSITFNNIISSIPAENVLM